MSAQHRFLLASIFASLLACKATGSQDDASSSAAASSSSSGSASSSASTSSAGGASSSSTSAASSGGGGMQGSVELATLDMNAQAALDGATHLITVVTDDWPSVPAKLTLYTRSGASWHSALGPFDAVVGNTGLNWGRGLTQPPMGTAHLKHEGDGSAPAGLFRLGTVMGYDATGPSGLMLPYRQSTPDLVCVDDPSSPHYNTIQSDNGAVDWNSSEPMYRPDDLYQILALIDHNGLVEGYGAVPGGGSCIFLHIWEGLGSSTVGCTALDENNLTQLLVSIPSFTTIVFAQLPHAQYEAAVSAWGLPAID